MCGCESVELCQKAVSVMLLGCTIVEFLLNIFIGRINGRIAHPSVRRNENGPLFSTTGAAFFSRYYDQALSVWLFMICHLLKAQPIIAIVLGKATLFHHGLNGSRERTIRSGLCLISASVFFCFFFWKKKKKAENGCSRRELERGGASGGLWAGGHKDVSLGASVLVPTVWKVPNFVIIQALSCLTLQATNFIV